MEGRKGMNKSIRHKTAKLRKSPYLDPFQKTYLLLDLTEHLTQGVHVTGGGVHFRRWFTEQEQNTIEFLDGDLFQIACFMSARIEKEIGRLIADEISIRS